MKAGQVRMPDIFLTWAEDEQEAAGRLAGRLQARGFQVLWHPDDLPPDDDDGALRRVIESASAVVALWSASCAQSAWVVNEAIAAHAMGKLVSAHLDDFDPAARGDAFDGTRSYPEDDIRGIVAALAALGVVPPQRRLPDPPPLPAPPPPAAAAPAPQSRLALAAGVFLAMSAGAGLAIVWMQFQQPGEIAVAELPADRPAVEAAPAAPAPPAPAAVDPVQLAFELAKASGTLEAWDIFLAGHGSSRRADQARFARASLLETFRSQAATAFDDAYGRQSPEAWKDFLRRFGYLEPYVEEEWFRIARAAIATPAPVAPAQADLSAEQAFAAAEQTATIGSWDGFLADHGTSAFADEAEKKRGEIYGRILSEAAAALAAAEKSGMPQELQGFVDRYASLEAGMPELKPGLDKARSLIESVKPPGQADAQSGDCVRPDIAVASSSSVYKGDEKATGRPAFAIDGNEGTSWTLNGGEEKIAFHFSEPLAGAVGVRIRNAGRAASTFQATVLAGEAGSEWQWNKSVTVGANQDIRWKGTRNIQSVALVTSGAGWAELSEVCVLRGAKTAGP
jgi:TIR domain